MATKSQTAATGIAVSKLTPAQRSALETLVSQPGTTVAAALAAATSASARTKAERAAVVRAVESVTPFEDKFMKTLVSGMFERLKGLREAGVEFDTLGDPEALAERVMASVPLVPSPLEDLTGPFYDTTGLRTWLDTSRQALADRVKANTLLGLQTGDGAWVYPAWQFTDARKTIPHLADVLRALARGTGERWTWALWLTAPNEDWAGKPAWRWLAEGRDPEPVLFEARANAARWVA